MSSSKTVYAVAGSNPWNRQVFESQISNFPGHWIFIDSSDDLTLKWVSQVNPRYIFFLHWSHIVPEEIVNTYECVCFHMTDVPYGRGGSPLQNLIVRGHRETKLTALRMVPKLDAGPVYLKRDLSLEGSTAEEVFIRSSKLSASMIQTIIEKEIEPDPQKGDPVVFQRRRPEQSEISEVKSLEALFDFIRMLDAEGYPPAFIEEGGFRFEFRRASRYDRRIEATVTILPTDQ
ncbi:methionyl-tRNA formyltransferase [Salisaeta longa]|uniref:methionyl-tRNA formyltransferase n=1 Tax=Salisaeta longa TaxID=503170 RepID=UPI0003B6431D|nr:methionyl-tRNA formyltransferase [Salisaeta longa]